MTKDTELLIIQLEIVAEHCNETGLRAGKGAVIEAIKIIKDVAGLLDVWNRVKKKEGCGCGHEPCESSA